MLRRPPRFTLLPHTALFRSRRRQGVELGVPGRGRDDRTHDELRKANGDEALDELPQRGQPDRRQLIERFIAVGFSKFVVRPRSEEQTSELQSQSNTEFLLLL